MKSLYETKYVFTLPCQKSASKSICKKYFLPFEAKTAKQQIFKNGPNQLIFWAWHKIWKVYMKLNMFLPYHLLYLLFILFIIPTTTLKSSYWALICQNSQYFRSLLRDTFLIGNDYTRVYCYWPRWIENKHSNPIQ